MKTENGFNGVSNITSPVYKKYNNNNTKNSFVLGKAGKGMGFYSLGQTVKTMYNEGPIITDPKNEII